MECTANEEVITKTDALDYMLLVTSGSYTLETFEHTQGPVSAGGGQPNSPESSGGPESSSADGQLPRAPLASEIFARPTRLANDVIPHAEPGPVSADAQSSAEMAKAAAGRLTLLTCYCFQQGYAVRIAVHGCHVWKSGVSHEPFVKAGGSQGLPKESALEHDTLLPNNSTPATGQPSAPVRKAELKSGDAVGEDNFLEKMPFFSVLRCVEAGKVVVSILHTLGVYGRNAIGASHLSHAICALYESASHMTS